MNQERFRANLNRRCAARRDGFTLVELLMVIVVIGILSSLLVVASMSVLGTSREAATKSTIVKVNTLLKQRMAAFEVMLDREYKENKHQNETPEISPQTPGDLTAIRKVIFRKKRFKKYFPQTWTEAQELGKDLGLTIPNSEDPSSIPGTLESAEVLYFLLTQTAITGQGEVGQDAFLASELADKDGDGRKELVDSWGNPFRFYRWPCRLIKPTAAPPAYAQPPNSTPPNPETAKAENAAARTQIPALTTNTLDAALNTDPDNPLHLDIAGAMVTPNDYIVNFHIPRTFYTPLVVSAGVDGLFGLESPNDYISANAVDNRQSQPDFQTSIENSDPVDEIDRQKTELYDNLTNLNALAGGTL